MRNARCILFGALVFAMRPFGIAKPDRLARRPSAPSCQRRTGRLFGFAAAIILSGTFATAPGAVRAGDIPASLYTYRPAGELPGEANGRVFALTYDQEGQRLARGDFGNSLSVFDVGENRMIWSVTGTDIHPVSLVDLWPVNALLAAQTAEDGAKILAFDLGDGRLERRSQPL